MANLKEVRERISSVKNTQQITRAMKMVAAAKLRRAQQAIQQMRPYSEKQLEMLRNILSNLEEGASTGYNEEREIKRVCIVVVTSQRGLAGAFNTNIAKVTARRVDEAFGSLYDAGKIDFVCIGKKGYEYLERRLDRANYDTDPLDLFSDLTFERAEPIVNDLMEKFTNKTYDRVEVAYSHFVNAAYQKATVEQFLPVPKVEAQDEEGDTQTRADYIFEPDKNSLLEYLVPSILKTTFYRYLLDTHASEHGARMTAMDQATENAQELLKELRLEYNKARQEAITKEILEIVSGAAALEG